MDTPEDLIHSCWILDGWTPPTCTPGRIISGPISHSRPQWIQQLHPTIRSTHRLCLKVIIAVKNNPCLQRISQFLSKSTLSKKVFLSSFDQLFNITHEESSSLQHIITKRHKGLMSDLISWTGQDGSDEWSHVQLCPKSRTPKMLLG